MSLLKRAAHAAVPRVGTLAPGTTSSVVHRALRRAIGGFGPFLKGAAAAAEAQLAEQTDVPLGEASAADVDAAVADLVGNHVRLAGAQGFATNIGGLVTLPATVPINLAGLALLQCRMVAGVAHLRGYDLQDPAVHNAVLTCILGEKEVGRLVSKGRLPARPRGIATGAGLGSPSGAELDKVVASQVTTALVSRVAGRRAVTTVSKRVPVVGGLVGAATDARATSKVGGYAGREFTRR